MVNVTEHGWEFGVLRAIGISKWHVMYIYIYEAVALVLSCLVLGTAVGVIISITLTLQFNLFTEMPFKMQFPADLFSIMFVLSLITAVVASALPAYQFNQKTITDILRKT
jgi:ABC-type antimicrobial peptide transport system permease subunit